MKLVLEGTYSEIRSEVSKIFGEMEKISEDYKIEVCGPIEQRPPSKMLGPEPPKCRIDEATGVPLRTPSEIRGNLKIYDEASAVIQQPDETVLTEQPKGNTSVTHNHTDTFESATGIDTNVSVAAPEVELDRSGEPWDGDKHAGTKSKTVDGNWKRRRNVAKSSEPKEAASKGATTNDAITVLNGLIAKGAMDYGDVIDVLKEIGYGQIADVPAHDIPKLIEKLKECDENPSE